MSARNQAPSTNEPMVLTVPQAAKLLQLSENTVYSLISQNAIPHTRFGKLIRIPRWGLMQFIAQSSGAPLPVAFVPQASVDVDQPIKEDD
jgi:excisionase family DNA binding protein